MDKLEARVMYKSSDVAERIKYMAKLRGQTMKVVLEEAGLNFNAMTHMKTSMPKADNLAKLADYLRCSVDFLLGRTEEVSVAETGIGGAATTLSENSREMLSLFEQLPERQQLILIGRLQEMVAPMAPDDTIETAAPRHNEGEAV